MSEEDIDVEIDLDPDDDDEGEEKIERKARKNTARLYISDSPLSLAQWGVDAAERKRSVQILVPDFVTGRVVCQHIRAFGIDAENSGVIDVDWAKMFVRQHDGMGIHPDINMEMAFVDRFKYTKLELEEITDALLRRDANREMCRQCTELAKERGTPEEPWLTKQLQLPYGQETGHIEWKIQYDKEDNPILDRDDNTMYIGFPELVCQKGHRWYKGEGPRRDIRGPNPILFETHLYNRKRREIHVKDGVPDPAYTMDRWGKRPTLGMYYRIHPQGRKVNTDEQRRKNGASFYR